MWRLCVVALLVASVGCAGVAFRSNVLPENNVVLVNGFVSSVQTSSLAFDGAFIDITSVTFLINGFANTINFCGVIPDQFPIDSIMNVTFTPDVPCATVVLIAIEIQN
jgi:hypothetical protein